MTTVYLAVLLSFYSGGHAQDTLWAPTHDKCMALVRQWEAQPPLDVGLLQSVRFKGYCRPIQVENEWPLKALTAG